VELAGAFAKLGSEVLLMEKENQLLPGEDPELAKEVQKMLQRQGVKVTTGAGSFQDLVPKYDKVLVVTGRQTNADTLGLEKGEIVFTKKGITVNEYLETTVPGVFAAGDITGNCYLAYIAQAEGIAAAENAMGKKTTLDYSTIPRVVFSSTPIASVGVRSTDISPESVSIGRFPLAANGRSFIEGERTGWIKLISDKASGRVLGVQIAGPHADELIPIASIAIKHKLTIEDLSRELFFHPSVSEAIYGAAEDASGVCVDLPKRQS
jgi:dihydrolipoamide dehydrogenase